MTEPVLTVERLSLQIGRTRLFDDLSFTVERGAALAIIGPNGAGKTVLFRCLIGAQSAQGTIRWAAGTRIGYVPQKLDLVRDVPLTGLDFLHAKPTNHAAEAAPVADTLREVGLSRSAAELSIGALSGGQFQRLLIAFALLGAPNVLLLDEPTAGIDEAGQERVNELVHRLQRERGLTVLMISHDLTVVSSYATSVLCLSRDRVCFGPPRILTPELLGAVYGAPAAVHIHNSSP